jgi:copper transporter 1
MDSGSGNDGTSSMSMIPYLHFTRGDTLWLQKIAPKSKGAVAGACVFLFALALFERFYSSWNARIQARWALAYVSTSYLNCVKGSQN